MGRYGDLRQVKQLLNQADSVTSQDDKLNRHIAEADNFIDTQLSVFVATPISNPDANIISLASSLSAAIATYWNSQSKSPDLLQAITHYQKRIQSHIQSAYGKRSENGMGESRWGKTASGIIGTEPNNALQGGFADEDLF